jgi:hypothetical protein
VIAKIAGFCLLVKTVIQQTFCGLLTARHEMIAFDELTRYNNGVQ